MSRRPGMSDFNEEPIHRHGYHERPPNTHAMGTRGFDDETTHQPHKSLGRPNGADERRMDNSYEEATYHHQGSHTTPQHALGRGTRDFVDGVPDHSHGMEDFVDSLQGTNMGSRHHSKHVKFEDSQDKAHYMDGFMEDKEARHAKYSHEDDHRKEHRHGEHRQGDQQHKQHQYHEPRHGGHQHKEHQQKEHQYQERRHGEHQHKEHQQKEHQHKEHQPKEHQHKEHKHQEHRHGEHRQGDQQHKQHQYQEPRHGGHQHKEHQQKELQYQEPRHGEHQLKEHQLKEHQPKEHKHKEHQPKEHKHKEHQPKEHQHKEHQLKEHQPKEHKHKEHQHKEHRHEEERFKKFNKKLYESALQPFSEKGGSPYPCKQSEIDFHQKGVFAKPNKGPFVSAMQATEEIMRWNDEKRAPPRDELAIIRDLTIAVHDAEKNLHFGPDLVIKTFADLDRIFFGGRLRGNVAVSWVSNLSHGTRGAYGETEFHKPGSCHIRLSAEAILLQKWTKVGKNPVATMFGTLLHEMCHAYGFVRCPEESLRGDAHGKHFSTKIGVIHDRAVRILGTWAVEDWEPYKQQFFLPKDGEKSRKESIGGKYDSGKKYDGGERKHAGTRREEESWGTRKGTDCVVM
ncbi:MAG: hypothetical protein ALECFALPRED_009742 [Alectoria fallacina]|uniref:SprT-like domain-containing protein n=1 Tax=Alectoria fallacina TaxID=1903189 RepID=A0A8H3J8K2_9LECA|nr:MAG: hypothetical protein ALECFALPRED_009742 [Alectoria fallacina]